VKRDLRFTEGTPLLFRCQSSTTFGYSSTQGGARLFASILVGILIPAGVIRWAPTTVRGALDRAIFVDPLLVVGKQFPLLPYLSTSDRNLILQTDQLVIFYSHECEHCRAYLDSVKAGLPRSRQESILLIDVVPGGEHTAPFKYLATSAELEFVVSVPVSIKLARGTILNVDRP
jgi:hypothetical protein